MNTVRVYRLQPTPKLFACMKAAQMEAAKVWNLCCEIHKQARMAQQRWPDRDDPQKATKGQFALHSQSVQMVVHAFLGAIDTTRQLRQSHPKMKMKYPYKTKHFYPVKWPAQAVTTENGRVILPMGRGRKSLVLPIELPPNSGACTLVWNNGFELHVCIEQRQAEKPLGDVHATVDLGEIHLAAVATNTGKALVVSGRGIRALKRQRSKQLGKLAKKQSRCKKQSRRWRKLQRAKNKLTNRAERRIRDLRHNATRQVINFCVEQKVGLLFIGNPHSVRCRDKGRHHNQRMALWEYGKDIDYLTHKSKQAHIMSFTGSERGTSSQCPVCEHKHKPKGRNWACKACGFTGHRDIVGSVNMHRIAYDQKVLFPRSVTYLRPGRVRRSSRADAPLASSDACCLSQSTDQPLLLEQVPLGTG
ncbi:MAG TPA: transposase [Ktedonobacteraceae bacterium]|nr:transposase [Ktedonobacteraceae bacterium]